MILTALIAAFGVALVGIGAVFGLRYAVRREFVFPDRRITWREYGIAQAAVTLVVIPLVMWIGNMLSVANLLSFDELRAGVEQQALDHVVLCYAGHSGSDASAGKSNCTHTFISGTYSYIVTYLDQDCTTDSKGNRSCTTVIKHRTEWASIYTPFATVEHTYEVTWYIYQRHGSTTYPAVYFEQNPIKASDRDIPNNVPRGAPADWLDAKAHIEAGDPRPVKDVFQYDNYILASKDELLKAVSYDVERYRKQQLLPDHTANILSNPISKSGRPVANEVSFVGVKVADEAQWQDALMRFNTAFGSKLQGDLHVVIIDSNKVDDPHKYLKALRAFWLSDYFGKRALAKNGVILVIGTGDNATVDWAQADTGMPFGNNIMKGELEELLPGKKLDPDVIFGHPKTQIVPATKEGEKDKVTVTLSEPKSVLEDVMFGENGFVRPCMHSKPGCIGYDTLVDKIEPTTGQRTLMILVAMLLSLLFWWGVAVSSFLERKSDQSDSSNRGYTKTRSYSTYWSQS